jgi:pilus assembly protein CpaF
MGLHDRLKGGNNDGSGDGLGEVVSVRADAVASQQSERTNIDPYAELKTRVHHACIAKLGPELYTAETTADLNERVLRAVTEQLALDRTPLTRDERRQLVREISDDILGYGPLEPLLRDDSVTEVMVNASDQIFVERAGKIEKTTTAFVDDRRWDAEWTSRPPWSTPVCPTEAA